MYISHVLLAKTYWEITVKFWSSFGSSPFCGVHCLWTHLVWLKWFGSDAGSDWQCAWAAQADAAPAAAQAGALGCCPIAASWGSGAEGAPDSPAHPSPFPAPIPSQLQQHGRDQWLSLLWESLCWAEWRAGQTVGAEGVEGWAEGWGGCRAVSQGGSVPVAPGTVGVSQLLLSTWCIKVSRGDDPGTWARGLSKILISSSSCEAKEESRSPFCPDWAGAVAARSQALEVILLLSVWSGPSSCSCFTVSSANPIHSAAPKPERSGGAPRWKRSLFDNATWWLTCQVCVYSRAFFRKCSCPAGLAEESESSCFEDSIY